MNSMDISSLSQFVDEISKLQNNDSTILYRGQEDSLWPLVPAYYRENVKDKSVGGYEKLIHSFRKEIENNAINPGNYFTGDVTGDDLESLAQHYGLPTKLFDWTYSAYIALFFAYGGTNKKILKVGKNVSIYILFYNKLEEQINKLYDDERTLSETYKVLKKQRNYVRKHDNRSSIEKRIRSQKGTFLYIDTENGDLNDFFQDNNIDSKDILLKFDLPSSLQEEILSELYFMGLDPARLMGDMDGVCQSVYNRILRF